MSTTAESANGWRLADSFQLISIGDVGRNCQRLTEFILVKNYPRTLLK